MSTPPPPEQPRRPRPEDFSPGGGTPSLAPDSPAPAQPRTDPFWQQFAFDPGPSAPAASTSRAAPAPQPVQRTGGGGGQPTNWSYFGLTPPSGQFGGPARSAPPAPAHHAPPAPPAAPPAPAPAPAPAPSQAARISLPPFGNLAAAAAAGERNRRARDQQPAHRPGPSQRGAGRGH
ncbi:hypothetical protein [Streptomyces lichenis]|uniref:Uncharacterized protein n=1 Tax=Streptomyces lichenis TaxID=2306967 RepID=A0ABT0IA70_9ACTN|nr:hypothetical protein [Streptomyces lichenis]MCK8678224.1 hypothetical protein [Streptomyces lichenis]